MLFMFISALLVTSESSVLPNLSPVILVPGDGGSQFEAKLHKPSTVHSYCSKDSDWFPLWLSLEETLFADCLIDNMRLQYDNVTRKSFNQPGVQLRQPGFGNTSTVEWLDPYHPVLQYKFSYFYQIVEAMVSKLNYTRCKDVRGAPYDFRKAPNEMEEFLGNLKSLIEETYYMNENRATVLLGHSMGNLYILYFLNRQSQTWKDKFVRSFISLGGPWGGSVKPIRLMSSGDNLGVRIVFNPLQIRTLQRSLPSTAFLMPYDTFWASDEVLVYRPTVNYTVKDYERFFNDIGFPDGYLMRKDTENLVKTLDHPQVETHCLYGGGVDTPDSFRFTKTSSNWMDYQPDVIPGDGDGTVNTRSLVACKKWVGTGKHPVYMQMFNKTEHVAMLSNKDIIDYIIKVLSS